MSLTATVDLSALRSSMGRLAAVSQRTLKEVTRQQATLTVSHPRSGIIANTPPSNAGHRGKAAQKAGEINVDRDIKKVYRAPNDLWLMIRDKAGRAVADNFWAYVKLKRWQQASAISEQVTGFRLLLSLTGREHAARRNPRTGRVSGKYRSAFVAESRVLDAYIERKQSHVGLLASGWFHALQDAGLSTSGVPSWVARHSKPNGFARPVETPDSYQLTLGNSSTFGADADHHRRLKAALSYRLSSMSKDIRRTIERAAKASALA